MKKTKIEIIDELVAYYSEDVTRRGIEDTGGCTYWSEEMSNSGENKTCGVGYCLENAAEFQCITAGEDITLDTIDYAKFKKEYEKHNLEFWQDIQCLHDSSSYWNENGITRNGLDWVSHLKEEYAEQN